MMYQAKCIIFDVGGVITSEKIETIISAANRVVGKKVFVRRSPIRKKLLRGKITKNEYYSILSKRFGIPASELVKTFDNEYRKHDFVDKDVIKIINKIRKAGYKTAILSNATKDQKSINMKRHIYQLCHSAVLSCDVGHMKPQKRIFQIAIKKLKYRPEECVFIDDRKDNLVVPKEMGMKTIHFRNAAHLRKDLKRLGVNI